MTVARRTGRNGHECKVMWRFTRSFRRNPHDGESWHCKPCGQEWCAYWWGGVIGWEKVRRPPLPNILWKQFCSKI